MNGAEGLMQELAGSASSVARCWRLTRRDGTVYGFTDHDCKLEFDGTVFKADTGLSASALAQSTGLSVDNTEALGALSDAAITEEDILAGRFDGAEIEAWLVHWQNTDDRMLLFRGTIGEIERQSGAFKAELRGLSEALNQPQGRVYQRLSPGDGPEKGGMTLPTDQEGFFTEVAIDGIEDQRIFRFDGLDGFEPGWFARGRFEVLSGVAKGLVGVIKNDRYRDGARFVETWEEIRAAIAPGDMVRIEAGFDGTFDTARYKFLNGVDFRGFPTMPGEDWLMAYPANAAQSGDLDGSSLGGGVDDD